MKITRYQLIKIGEDNLFYNSILSSFYDRIKELGLNKECIIEIDEHNFSSEYASNAPTFCIYFGSSSGNFTNQDILATLKKDATLILPVVSDLAMFAEQIPPDLHNVNGFELKTLIDTEKLVSLVLEGLSLLRPSRRLFISYKRDESTSVAIQLFEQLEKNGFDVFLDTHSIRPGEPFQDELWHRMADSDVVVMLNTPNFMNSKWTTQELAQANAMSIGIVQLVFPKHKLENEAELSIPLQLTYRDFKNCKFGRSTKLLNSESIEYIVGTIESIRARSLGARQDNIVSEFMSFAYKLNVNANLQPEKYISVANSCNEKLIVIPTVGVPQALTYYQKEQLMRDLNCNPVSEIHLLYDHRNVKDKWLDHLAWLDNYLPLKTIQTVNIEKWLLEL